jgi:hypothetical protein
MSPTRDPPDRPEPPLGAHLYPDADIARPIIVSLRSGEQASLTADEAAELGRCLLLLAGAATERHRQARAVDRRQAQRRLGDRRDWSGVERRTAERRGSDTGFQDRGWVQPIRQPLPGSPDDGSTS